MTPSVLRLLRIPFSVYLMPVFWFALAFVPISCSETAQSFDATFEWDASPAQALAVFLILHLLVYPASNGFNSWHDRDTGPIGGLAAPPPPPPVLLPLVRALDVAAFALALLLDMRFAGLLLAYILVSRAYSAPPLRLKARPYLGTAAVVIFQGFVTYLAVQAGSGVASDYLFSAFNLTAGAGVSLLLLGSYPLTQIYQHAEDAARGDRTLSRALGVAGTFRFARLIGLLGAAYVVGLGWLPLPRFPDRSLWLLLQESVPGIPGLRLIVVFGLWMLPTALYVALWERRAAAGQPPTHADAMGLNKLASLSVSAFFGLAVLWQIAICEGWLTSFSF
ncbi:MAG: prenyltransferase [Hymenobacteraceae bacterium]|nr:prenyltransferase [Hymenobacteraceae bacterium]